MVMRYFSMQPEFTCNIGQFIHCVCNNNVQASAYYDYTGKKSTEKKILGNLFIGYKIHFCEIKSISVK